VERPLSDRAILASRRCATCPFLEHNKSQAIFRILDPFLSVG